MTPDPGLRDAVEAPLDDRAARPGGQANTSRRSSLLRGAAALAAACGLAACGTPQASPAPRPGRSLASLNDDAVVAGEQLDTDRLRRFYARRGFEPVWTNRRRQADQLVAAVLNAGDHGLDPELFHANLLQRRASFPPMRRELLLTDAILAYADALAHGAVPLGMRKDNEALTPGLTDVDAALDAAIDSADAAAAIEALAPATASYRSLREALSQHHASPPILAALARGRPAFRPLRGNPARNRAAAPPPAVIAANRRRTLEVNLERQRWLPRALPADRVWVNVADQRLVLYRADRPVFTTRVVVGDDAERNQSPEFSAVIDASFFNPPWVIPSDIVAAEILPRISRDPGYLARHNMVLRDNGEIEQKPGPEAGLGVIMFLMPNRFDVYLHDTPDRSVFARDNRRLSHGCIRVQNPRELAALLYEQPIETINEGIAEGSTTHHKLPVPVPVFVTYQTAFVDADETLQFRPDFYNRDAEIARKLQRRAPEAVIMAQMGSRPGLQPSPW